MEIRTYIKTSGKECTETVKTLADGRIRTDWRSGSTLVASKIEPAPVVPPPPPPPPPPPATKYPTYKTGSPWTQNFQGLPTDPANNTWISALTASPGGKLTSDPDQYAGPIFRGSLAGLPLRKVRVSGSFNIYDNGDTKPRTSTVGSWGATSEINLPIPDSILPSAGSDGHVILVDMSAGVEYGFWQFERASDGSIDITNGYKVLYATSLGSFQDGKSGRGAGTPYGAGCFRKEDMEADATPHALAIALNYPQKTNFRWPASKTDGAGPSSMPPEGAIMLLDPNFDFAGYHPIAAKALSWAKTHGAVVIDNSGRNKLYFEDRKTAGWDSGFDEYSVSNVPWTAWRFITAPTKPTL